MKKVLLFTLLVFVCSFCFAQRSIYVSAKGDDFKNDGLSEAKPFKSLHHALISIYSKYEDINKITVIGTLDINSHDNDGVFNGIYSLFLVHTFSTGGNIKLKEIIITGKPNAVGMDRAVLSAKRSQNGVVEIQLGNYRFENIEIVGGEGSSAHGILLLNGNITLGPGVIVQNNAGYGIIIKSGTCIIDGGEIRNNYGIGVLIDGNPLAKEASKSATLILRNGTIKNNSTNNPGGGVNIKAGTFNMSGGSISENNATAAGGVFVDNNGTFNMSGGTITKNSAKNFGGGIVINKNGVFKQTGGTISGNQALFDEDITKVE